MLQQTQVATVIPFFGRFIARFPDIHALAAAPEEEVLRAWEGLGYYRRARQLHRAARVIVDDYGGEFPVCPTALQTLPGIGRYTAGAILSIAFAVRQPILEANTVRLLSRLSAYRHDVDSAEGRRHLWRLAEVILPSAHVGDFNQALMELGATVCTIREPQCGRCPVASLCRARAEGIQSRIPVMRRGPNYEDTHEACVIVWKRRQVLLRQCGDEERWSGLWDFPRFAWTAVNPSRSDEQLIDRVRELTGVVIKPDERLTTLRHSVTRFRITLECFQAHWQHGRACRGGVRWIGPGELSNYPLSMTARTIASLLVGEGGTTKLR
jgi:A/G-specific adenine glycosylase